MEKYTKITVDSQNPHVTILKGEKSKKQLKKIKTRKQTFNRKVDLSLLTLPREGSKYEEFRDLHKLWKSHVKSQFTSLPSELSLSSQSDFQRVISKMEFQGSKMEVIASKCPTLVNHSGIVLLETRETFKIISKDDQIRTIPKRESVFFLKIGNLNVKIFGKHITIRPAERSIKKIKNFMDIV